MFEAIVKRGTLMTVIILIISVLGVMAALRIPVQMIPDLEAIMEPGDTLGICLDTMNLLVMLEEPVRGTERVLPWVTATHIKDGDLVFGSEGMCAFPTEIGHGSLDLASIARRLAQQPAEIMLFDLN